MENLVLENSIAEQDEEEEDTKSSGSPEFKAKNDALSKNCERHLHPIFVLEQGFSKVKSVGSSTALIGIKNKQELTLANLGDSGFQCYRKKGKHVFIPHRSKEQVHSFNTPY